MKAFKQLALAAAASLALSVSAHTALPDDELADVSGQDGVSILAQLNINIGSWQYTDTDTNGGSVSFNNIGIHGILPLTIDIMSNAAFGGEVLTALQASGMGLAQAASLLSATATSLGVGSSDVVRFAIPAIADTSAALVAPSITVASINMGNSTKSYGAMALNRIDARGSTVYMWAH